jgi:hypothetical protein
MPGAGHVIEVDLGTDAAAAAIAITVTDTRAPGFVSVGRCDDLAGGSPSTSNLNHLTGQTVTNVALSPLDDGKVCLFTLAPAHIIVDVQAELVENHALGLIATSPHRLHDSRES